MRLTVHSLGAGGVEFWPPAPLPSPHALKVWQTLTAEFFTRAAAGRAVCLVTDAERASSLKYEKFLEVSLETTIAGRKWLVGFTPQGTVALFEAVVSSSEFYWDAVRLAFFTPQEIERLRAGFATIDVDQPERASIEIISPFNDGCGVQWLHPNRDAATAFAWLQELAKAAGWQLVYA
jgi:hypothetical protein